VSHLSLPFAVLDRLDRSHRFVESQTLKYYLVRVITQFLFRLDEFVL